jgi:membrane dipeptidase
MKYKTAYTDMLGFLRDVGMPTTNGATRKNILASGVKLFHTTTTWPMQDWDTTLKMHQQSVNAFKAHPDIFRIIHARKDIERTSRAGKVGVILGIQDPESIGMRMHRIKRLFDAGIRIIQVAYQRKGPFGCGFLAESEDTGLTMAGRRFVEAVNKNGLILDLSHSAPQTSLDCLECTRGPTMISHTICRGIYDHPRGITDRVLSEIVKHDDVIVGILAMTFFLDATDNSLNPLINHIRYLADRIGPQRVAIGTDAPVGGFTDLIAAEQQFRETTQRMMDPHGEIKSRWPTHIPAVSDDAKGFDRIGLELARYFNDEEIEGIRGQNGRRFLGQQLPSG